jgi:hypothetical protein
MQDRVRLEAMLLNSDAELTDGVQIPDFLKKSGILPSHESLIAILQSFSRGLGTSLPIALQSQSAIA